MVTQLIDAYCQAWSASDESERLKRLQQVWSPNATYTDPTVHLQGATGLLQHIAKVQARWPGSKVIRTSEVDHHHEVARFAWHAVEANGNELVEGIDIAFVSSDGTRIEKILGFFGPVKLLA